MALLAGTTVGLGYQGRWRAQISGERLNVRPEHSYRLVAQTYRAAQLTPGGVPAAGARPLGSAQRAVTAEELAAGVALDIVQIGEEPEAPSEPVVVAWIELGDPDLEYDARQARPEPAAALALGRGAADSRDRHARILLRRCA